MILKIKSNSYATQKRFKFCLSQQKNVFTAYNYNTLLMASLFKKKKKCIPL